jgi:CheY-specific phosphatase CheX
MDIDTISPFLRSAERVFATMLQLPVECAPAPAKSVELAPDAVAIHAELEPGRSRLVLGMERSVAQRIAGLLIGVDPSSESVQVADALCELVELIRAGGLSLGDQAGAAAPPSVFEGVGRPLGAARGSVAVACRTECGSFVIKFEEKPARKMR